MAEPPSLSIQPRRETFAELDRNVDIPCLATGTRLICHHCMSYFKDCVGAVENIGWALEKMKIYVII